MTDGASEFQSLSAPAVSTRCGVPGLCPDGQSATTLLTGASLDLIELR